MPSNRRLAGALAVLAAALVGACGDGGPGEWVEIEGGRMRSLDPGGVRDGGFAIRAPGETGITAANVVPPERILENRTLADGSGVAVGDFDADGLADVYLPRVAAPNALYRNLGGWRFEDATDAAGVALGEHPSTGAVFADVDGDGDLDLLVTGLGVPNVLFRNEGDGRFTDVSAEAGFTVARASRSLALADVDGDGDLDLYVANNKTRVVQDLFAPEERTRDRVVVRDETGCHVAPDLAGHWQVDCFDGVTRWLEIAEEDEFYLNDGSGRFTLVPFTGGRFRDAAGDALETAPRDWGLSVRFHDLDGDGAPDLYVCNDFETPDRIWMNDGAGSFREADTEGIRTTSLACMAVDFADVDRDGLEDFFTADMEPLDGPRRKRLVPPMRSDTTPPGAVHTRVQRARNTLQLARGDGTYFDVAPMAGVDGSEWTWGTLFVDVDLDGYEDLVMATGHVWDLLDADVSARVSGARRAVDWREERSLFPSMPLRNLAFRNRGDGTFEEWGVAWGLGETPDIAHGLARADFDLDGDPDLILTRLQEAPLVLENRSPAPRVAVRLAGRSPNTRGVGARIRVEGGAVPVQVRTLAAGVTYLSGSEPEIAFATGEADRMSVEVWWAAGGVTRIPDVPANHLVEIREPGTPPAPGGTERTGSAPVPVFEEVPIVASHVEPSAPELVRQPLLSERLAQPGPGVSWLDVDADGDPDLLMGAGRGGALTLLVNEDGRLRPGGARFAATPFDQTTILGVPGPDGRPRLLVGRMSYEAESPDAALAAPGVVEVSLPDGAAGLATEVPAVPASLESVGPLALGDMDGDGDLDLFVGGRVFPGRYPAPVSSHVYVNEDGGWRVDPGAEALLREVGVVSAALFTDVDGDGDPDLVLALDWGPIRILRNDGGRFRDATRALGLDAHTGRWNGIAAGDLDGDGRLDLVATSWGWNTGLEPSPERPLLAYHGDLDGNGTYEMIRAMEDPAAGGVAPIEDLTRLLPALPPLRRTVPSFEAYARSTMTDLFGEAIRRQTPLEARTLSHTLFLNRDDRFEAVPLPTIAQVAPSFHAGVADFDGDGSEDVFLSQNFFATVPGEARHDSGRSLWLAGDGAGGLTPVPGSESGIAVYGDPRGAALADYDADGRVDLAVSQNGAPLVLYRNVGATPGLRVRLEGPPANPDAIGAAMRVVYADGRGPLREVRAGSGYWSVDGATQVLGLRAEPHAVWVRWPGGREVEVTVETGDTEIVARWSEDG